jgi:hypothetical protein
MAEVYWIHLPEHTDMFSEGYIGYTSKTAKERFEDHVCTMNNKRDGDTHLYRAFRKYGKESLILETICICEEEYGLWLENKLRPIGKIGWNCCEGGGLPPNWTGKKRPSHHLQKWLHHMANKNVWIDALEIYEVFKQHGCRSRRSLYKLHAKYPMDTYESISKHFNNGWVPSEDREFLEWREAYLKDKENT